MNLHQIKLDFIPEHDRLLMCIATSDGKELALWFTRRCVKLIWGMLMKMVEASPNIVLSGASAEARAALLGMEHEKAVREADFSKPYAGEALERPLGAEPILVARIQASRDERGNHVMMLLPAKGQGVNLCLDDRLLHSFCKLLQDSVAKAEWELKLALPVTPLAPEEAAARTLN